MAVLFGGQSGEHDVSLRSAATIIGALDPARYEVVPVGITREGRWLTGGDPLAALSATSPLFAVGDGTTAEPVPAVADVSAASAVPALLAGGIDVVFPVLHGTSSTTTTPSTWTKTRSSSSRPRSPAARWPRSRSWPSPPFTPSIWPGWRGSISLWIAAATSSPSTRSTRSPASPPSACFRGSGRRAGSRWTSWWTAWWDWRWSVHWSADARLR